MRNIYHQYDQPENRVTHALMASLHADRALLGRFLEDLVKVAPPTDPKKLQVLEQEYPGEMELGEEEAARLGIPDGWIFNDEGWCVFIESKIQMALKRDQVERHRRTAERQGFSDITAVAIVVERPPHLPPSTTILLWRRVYAWLRQQSLEHDDWAHRAAEFLEIAETELALGGQLTKGSLTMFSGFHFDEWQPFNYRSAKLYLRNAMSGLRESDHGLAAIGVDRAVAGRKAITQDNDDGVWDFLSLKSRGADDAFNRHIHLTLGVLRQKIEVIVIVPNSLNTETRNRIIGLGLDGFQKLITQVVRNMKPTLKQEPHAVPIFMGLQRRWPTRSSDPLVDAHLLFDLRTAVPGAGDPKLQPRWLEAGFNAYANKNGSNYEFAIGVQFPYEGCPSMRTPGALDLIAKAWIACKPLIDLAEDRK
jgi:hypothetical protein